MGEKDWAYLARFSTPREIRGPAFLRFEGLDTLADVWLNGAFIGRFENTFREHAVEYLKVGVLDALDAVDCRYLVHVRAADAIVEGDRVAGALCAAKGCQPRELKVTEIQEAMRADGVDLAAKDREQSWLKG